MSKSNLKKTDKDECPHCKSKKIKKDGVKGGLIAKGSPKLIPDIEIYICTDCGNPFKKRFIVGS